MAKKSKSKADPTLVDITEVRSQASHFIEQYQKPLLFGGLAIILLVGGYFAYQYLYKLPRQKEAISQIFQAETQFERDSFMVALNNPGGGYKGFLDIIKSYSGTETANTAKYYAGVCYLNLGKFDEAIKYLEDCSPSGELLPITRNLALGDAYSEKNDMDKAQSFYEKAASGGNNELLTPLCLKRLGLMYEKKNNYKGALEAYNKIKDQYATSQEGRDIDKYVIRAKAMVK